MVNRFNEVYDEVSPSKNIDRYKILRVASIVEKETAKDEEKAMVAAVIYNRLKKGIKLCMDSTVIYGLSNFDGNLKKEDLTKSTPYNTYLFYGLPPLLSVIPAKSLSLPPSILRVWIISTLFLKTMEHIYFPKT